ncbi:MAG TPA: phospholipase D-like domain-containing protein [Salinivirgaceae bacterium]|nr:phospholipase D-like domain-containing protein [Salinivirgaceae bacterium]
MSLKLLSSPFEKDFQAIIKKTKRDIVFSSPYINDAGVSILLNSLNPTNKSINIVTNLSAQNIIDNVTQPQALLRMYSVFQKTTVASLAKLHAKVYIIDEDFAVITSANLTYGGLKSNFEYGVLIDDTETVKTVKKDILDYAALGHLYDKDFLAKIHEESKKIEQVQRKAEIQRSEIDLKLLLQQQQKIDSILETQFTDKETRHGVFAKTIKFLLENNKQLTTQQLYQLVQEIHPEMCNDTIKYSNGEKKWKIEVRQARHFLKKQGVVEMSVSHTSHQNIWSISNTEK